jgi:hypothetical protein
MFPSFPKIVLVTLTLATSAVFAQGVRTVNEPYVPPGSKATAPKEAGGSTGSSALDDVIGERMPPPKPEPVPFRLVKGFSVEEQLRVFAKAGGWDLAWQAPTWIVERDVQLTTDIDSSVAVLLKGANEAGTKLRAIFYRGNKTILITEF